jgi:hypothetical protein
MRSMRRVLWLLPLLALAGCKDETPQGAVKLTVTYEGFRPGCVRVVARDDASREERSTEVAGKGERTGGSLVVGVLPPDGWGSTVKVEAHAFEQTCTGDPVVSRDESVVVARGQKTEATLTLRATDADQDGYVALTSSGSDCDDSNAGIHPGAEERCQTGVAVDDNCNGQTDRVELQLNAGCTNTQNCQGTRQCGANDEVICAIPNPTLAYPDVDRDGHGDQNATATEFCVERPVSEGFVIGPRDDCDDRAVTVYTGAVERCDTVDNDCDGEADENFPLRNTACTDDASQCGGVLRCNGAANALACIPSQSVPTWYPDGDGDGFGPNSGAVQTCAPPAGFVNRGEDCDDGNPFTHPGARELCDTADNNCDSQPEASGVCPAGGPIWASRDVGTALPNWLTVVTPVSGEVGVVGAIDARARLAAGGNTFQPMTAGCGSNTGWDGLWIDAANNGRGYFGSVGGRLVFQDSTSMTCSEQHDINRWVRALVGIRNGANLEIHGVTSHSGDVSVGSTFIWNGGSTLTFGTTPVAPLYDLHGLSRATLFAVGGTTGLRIYRFNATSGQWQQETVPTVVGANGLNGVWVVNEKLAFAVGEQSTVLKWDGATWSKMAFPNDIESLRSVVAFGASSVHVAAYNGRIYRYDGQRWQVVHDDTSARFNDIAGTSPENLWVVGENGEILHWPQWPQ